MKFPKLKANNLLGKKFNLPEDFSGQLNIILIPFWEWQQSSVDTWIPSIKNIIAENSSINYYELPTVGKGNFLFRKWLDSVMYYGINNKDASSRTITIYKDQLEIANALGGNDLDQIYVLLLNKAGEFLWSTRGEFNNSKVEELLSTIHKFS